MGVVLAEDVGDFGEMIDEIQTWNPFTDNDDGWNREDDNANEAGVLYGRELFRSTREE